MRMGIVLRMVARADGSDGTPMQRLAAVARAAEDNGFAGIWTTDALGRGTAHLDALTTLGAIAAVTRTVEIGTCILQVSPRNPAELANRTLSLAALSDGRLRLGVGPGSTRGDFDVVGADYDGRFRTFEPAIATMRQAWAGAQVNRGALTPWPGVSAPPLLLAAWQNPAWVARAATGYDGWIASGLRSAWDQLDANMRIFRDAGGRRAIMANVMVALGGTPPLGPHGVPPNVFLAGSDAEAKATLRRLADIGFDDVLPFAPDDAGELKRLRDLI